MALKFVLPVGEGTPGPVNYGSVCGCNGIIKIEMTELFINKEESRTLKAAQ